MVVPFVVSVTLLGDSPSVPSLLGIVIIVVSVVLLGFTVPANETVEGEPQKGWFGLILITFACFGLQQSLSLLPSRWEQWGDFRDACNLRVPVYFSVQFVFYCLVLLARRRPLGAPALRLGFVMAVLILGGHFLIYTALDALTAQELGGITFPVIVSVSIMLMALYSVFVLRERSGPLTLGGIALGVVGVMLVAWR
jgi:drug/metabolite transporter (DMT)-like permease